MTVLLEIVRPRVPGDAVKPVTVICGYGVSEMIRLPQRWKPVRIH